MGSTNVLLVFFIIILIPLHFDFSACSNSRCRETEWKALMDFKGSLVDPHDRLSSWTGRDCCSWYGITCHNHTGFVQKIDLGGLHVLGGQQINSSFLNLEHLQHLDLSNNNLSGIQIPAFLGSLRNLQHLDLMDANFSGEIPQSLGNLSNLQHLSLGRSFFYSSSKSDPNDLSSKSLNWITGLSSLKSLELSGCNFSESADWLDSVRTLSSLSSMTLFDCGLVGMALSHHLNLTSLVHLDLGFNNFNSPLHPSFFNLTSLEDLYVYNSLLGPIPSMFQKLTALYNLDLSYNSFDSTFPDSLCTLTSLTRLGLATSSLHGSLPSCIGNLTNLTLLQLDGNGFSGRIPPALGNLTNLTLLRLDDNGFSGRIPPSLGNLTKLQRLDVSSNSLTGELDESFFDGLKNLKGLKLSGNQFVALNVPSHWSSPLQIQILDMGSVYMGLRPSFPAWLQTLTNLTLLSLRNTSVSGVIPARFQTSFPHLDQLDLSHNFLVGTIPTFNVINKLDTLDLSNNQFTGNIPDELCKLNSLTILNLANNKLAGRIPSCLGNLRELRVLSLGNNNLSGHIPYEIGCLNQLIVLQLNGNKLFGELPSSLQNLTQLTTLDLGKNELRGFLPNWIGNELYWLKHLMLQSNKFSGEIFLNLCQLPSLQILNLADNNLVGKIPPCLGNLSEMLSSDSNGEFLYPYTLLTIIIKGIELEYSSNLIYAKFISLAGNHLHGEIPNELVNLTELQSLNLSNNELAGKIPERIGNMKHLESLDLSRNKLVGTIPQSLANIDDLSYLKLSFNNLSGRIPSGGHFDTLNGPLIYEGNGELCGKPTTKSCDSDDLVPAKQSGIDVSDDDSEFDIPWIYAGIGPGFAVGFLGVIFLLYFKSLWRYRLFRFVEYVYYRF